MARIHVILQGFVDINLETDENINTHIIFLEEIKNESTEDNQLDS